MGSARAASWALSATVAIVVTSPACVASFHFA